MRVFPVFLALLLTAGLARAQTPVEPFKASSALSLELKSARWFDGQGFQKATLYVVDGKFTRKKPKKVHRSMDLKSQFLVPPLAEAHNHNLQNAWGVEQYAQRYLQDGVFYAALLCADPAGAEAARHKLNQDDSVDAIFATACFTSSDGLPLAQLTPAARKDDSQVIVVDSAAEAERKWAKVAERRPDLVKIMLAHADRPELRGRSDQFGRLGLNPDTAATLVRLAHRDGLRVVAHVDSPADFDLALRIGVDLIADLPGYFNPPGEDPEKMLLKPESAQQAARLKVPVITTTAATSQFPLSPALLEKLRSVQRRNLERLKAAGAPVLVGSDLFNGTVQAELRQLHEFGVFGTAELLKIATMDTPQALFPKRRIGCFDEGCEASFLLLGKDPLQDATAIAMPLLRVMQGRILSQMDGVADGDAPAGISTDGGAKKGSKPAAKKQPAPARAKPAPKASTRAPARVS
ncbi:amidohydrolase family protein [Pelomonas sp. SE-A7]|uniref:amidohydrolase family protein n=1 Tax=Pelomonas sp. SE-A7 TaxID=3054953 RepID=UPI00259CE179|nr:amidohydrolase family protein [Pelomonas sp. SE-A7]MDM4765501.1 amidohydrolase family protein [Pelomonas sp. SE-A7]